MSIIYQISEKIHEKTGWEKHNIFLLIHAVVWNLIAWFATMMIHFVASGSWQVSGILLFCSMGYAGVIIGFFGGALYLYQKE